MSGGRSGPIGSSPGTTSPIGSGGQSSGRATIPQPPLAELDERTLGRLAPPSQRVDLTSPSFSDPTTITNPLFPVGELHSAVLLGKLRGQPWRAETTLLPGTRTIDWNGQQIETLRSQFVAYLDGRIFEVAVDHYAQADDGSVWYLGEEAFTYKQGVVADTEGTWLAGVDGPPAMIMPAQPQVGDVYRTENIPGIVFEEVTVKDIGLTVQGPSGPVAGAMVGQELHMDEVRLEDKTFAPGYGEFHSGAGRTFEATALAVPADALPGAPPAELEALVAGALDVFDASRSSDWNAASAGTETIAAAWDAYGVAGVPQRLDAEITNALNALAGSVRARVPRAPLAALDVAQAGLDLQLRYRAPVEIDMARFDLWVRRLLVDASADDPAAVTGDVATLGWIRDRIPLASSDAGRVDDQLRHLEAAADAGETTNVQDAAAQLLEILAGIRPAT